MRDRVMGGLLAVMAAAGPWPLRAEEPPVTVPTQRIVPPAGPLDRTAPLPFQVPTDDFPLASEPEDNPDFGEGEGEGEAFGGSDPDAPLPDVRYGVADLPEPVRKTYEAIQAAARTGEVKAVADLVAAAPTPPALASVEGGTVEEILRAQSGDEEGREILAILLDVLDAGWVVVDEGTASERYVWPYFANYPADRLTAPQMVELFRIITAVDLEEMRAAGTYVFYRVEIASDGTWKAFQAGE